MEEEIFAKIKTKESFDLFVDELEIILKSLYEGKEEDFNSVLTNKVRAFVADFIRDKLSRGEVNLENYLKDILKKSQNLQTVSLSLAFEPTQGELDRFYSFISNACGRHVLLDVNYDPSLIGGVIIIYKGEYRDFSFRKIFEKEFAAEQENILRLLQK